MKSWFLRGMLAAAIAVPTLSGVAWAGDRVKKCSLETLDGQYLIGGTGTIFPPAFGGHRARSLLHGRICDSIDGDGTGADYVTLVVNGVKVPVTSPIVHDLHAKAGLHRNQNSIERAAVRHLCRDGWQRAERSCHCCSSQ